MFRNFCEDFFPNIICSHYLLSFWKLFSRVFPPILGHDIHVIIKYVFSHFFPTIFSPTYISRTIRVFREKLFRAYFSPHFWSRYSCEYKKRFFGIFCGFFFPIFCSHYFALSSNDFFPNIYFSHYSCVSGNIVSRVFFHHFLVTIFVWI